MNWKMYKGRIIGSIIGFILAIFFLTIGFWRTIFLLSFALVGFFVGSLLDDREKIDEMRYKLKEILRNIGRER